MHRTQSVQRSQVYMRRCHYLHVHLFSHSERECEWLDSSLRFSHFKAVWWQEVQFSQNSCLLHCHFACVTPAGSVPHTGSSYFDVMNIICNFCTATRCQEMCNLIVMIRTTADCVTVLLKKSHPPTYQHTATHPFTKISSPVKYPKLVNTSWKDTHLLHECPCQQSVFVNTANGIFNMLPSHCGIGYFVKWLFYNMTARHT